MKIILITDTHLVARGQRLFGADPAAALEACIADVNANHADADLCVFLGDLANHGDDDAYRRFREAVAGLRIEARYLLGNHDNRENFRKLFPEVPVSEGGFVQSCHDLGRTRLIFIDTNEAGQPFGSCCETRLRWLSQRLQERPDADVILFMHHPPFSVGMKHFDPILLRDGEALGRVLAGRETIRHIFFGHIHRPLSGSWRGIPVTALRGTSHQLALNFDDPRAVFAFERPAYGVVLVDDERVLCHMHDFADRSVLFDPRTRLLLSRYPDGQRVVYDRETGLRGSEP